MDNRLLQAYNRELAYVRDLASEFAAENKAVAAELGLAGAGPQDPYVERLLEGFALLAARTQLKLDARHPEFTQHLLEVVYPGFLSPIPACAITEFVADTKEAALLTGAPIARGSVLKANALQGGGSSCQFRTAHEVTLWPFTVKDVAYIVGGGALAGQGLGLGTAAKAAVRVKLAIPPGTQFAAITADSLTFYVHGEPTHASRLLEQVLANCLGVVVRGADSPPTRGFARMTVAHVGCEDEEALLPVSSSGLQGYRLLQEYFALPERLRFFRVAGLRASLAGLTGSELNLFLIFDRINPALENVLDANSLRLYCTPVVNLFPRSLDRVHVSVTDTEMLVTADTNRPMDYEVHSVTRMRAVGGGGEMLSEVLPMHLLDHAAEEDDARLYYSLQRRPRLRSQRQKQTGARTSYLGNEVFVSICDSHQRQYSGDLRQLDVEALCTNRDLPLYLGFDGQRSTFTSDSAVPVQAIRCLAGPSEPRSAPAFGDTAWRLISHLSLNYLSLIDKDPTAGASTLRSLLELYADPLNAAVRQQLAGVRSVAYQRVVRRIPGGGPIAYGRGLEITLTLDDNAFEGTGIFVLGAVLERFFARYTSINSFIQLRLVSSSRGEIKRWPPRAGRRQIL